MMTADRNAETLIRDHYDQMGILMMLVSKETIKLIQLANCCVGEAEPAGQTVMETHGEMIRRNIKGIVHPKMKIQS